jgi:hypothetical protein
MLYEPILPLTLPPPSQAITAVVVRAHYIITVGLVIVVVVHQRRHHPPLAPSSTSSPSRGWLLHGAACRHRHPRHCRSPPTQPHQRRLPRRLASSSFPPCDPPPRRRRALSALSIAHGAIIDRHVAPMLPPSRSDAASAAPARAPLVGIRTHCASAAVTLRRPAVYPPSLLGPPPPVGRRRRQHEDVDGCPWQPGAAKTTP